MTCDCISATHPRPSQRTPPAILKLHYVPSNYDNKEKQLWYLTPLLMLKKEMKIEVDACLKAAILALWKAGYKTIASCCTHGEGIPTIHLEHNLYSTLDMRDCLLLIHDVDERNITITARTKEGDYKYLETRQVVEGFYVPQH